MRATSLGWLVCVGLVCAGCDPLGEAIDTLEKVDGRSSKSSSSNLPPPPPPPTAPPPSQPEPLSATLLVTEGPADGGTTVAVLLTGASGGGLAVRVAGTSALDVTRIDAGTARFRTPANPAGNATQTVTVEVEVGGARVERSFTYLAVAPRVDGLSPNHGDPSGGVTVQVTGGGFVSGCRVWLGGAEASGVAIASATALSFVAPSGALGAADLVVRHPEGREVTLRGAFTYSSSLTPPPVPTNVKIDAQVGALALRWDAVAGSVAYTVYSAALPGVSAAVFDTKTNTTGTSLTLQGRSWTAPTYCVVTAVGAGGESLPSIEVSGTALPPISASRAVGVTFGGATDMVVDAPRGRLYVLDAGPSELVVVDIGAESVVARLPVSTGARALSLSPDGTRLVAVCLTQGYSAYRFSGEEGALHLFDPATLTQTAVHTIPVDPWDVEVLDNGYVYVPSASGQWTDLWVGDSATGVSLGRWGIRQQTYVTRTPDQGRLYGMNTDVSPRDVEVWYVPAGSTQTTPVSHYDSQYHGGIQSGASPLAVSADGQRGLTTLGQLLTLSTSQSSASDMVILHAFGVTARAPVADLDPRRMMAFSDAGRLELFDVQGLAYHEAGGYDASSLGAARLSQVVHGGTAIAVLTATGKLVLVPLPAIT